MIQSHDIVRVLAVGLVSSLLTLSSVSGCSLVIDSGRYVAERDAGPVDQGDAGPDGDVDQGPVDCGGVQCELGWSCLNGQTCVQCLSDDDCQNGLCDTVLHTCADPVVDCSVCSDFDTCVVHPAGGMLCLSCDRDNDGFLSTLSLCDDGSGAPRDCDDLEMRRFPGSAPVCNNGFVDTCAPSGTGSLQGLFGGGEFGVLPVHDVAGGVAEPAQLTVLALNGGVLPDMANTADEALGVFGFVTAGAEAELYTSAYNGYDFGTQMHGWRATGIAMNTLPSWPFDPFSVRAFTVGFAGGQLLVGTNGNVGGSPQLEIHFVGAGFGLGTYYSLAVGSDFRPPIAFRGMEYADLVYRDAHPLVSEYSQIRSIVQGTHTGEAFIPADPNFLIDTESGFVFTATASGLMAEAWDATGTQPYPVAMPTVDLLTGPPRFSRDVPADRIIGLLPYATGVRVVYFPCVAGELASCEPTATAIQRVLPGLQKFDFEIHDGVLVVVEQPFNATTDMVVAHILALDGDLALTELSSTPVPLISDGDTASTVTSIYALETAISFASTYVEVVVGVAAGLDGGGIHVLTTSLRACLTP